MISAWLIRHKNQLTLIFTQSHYPFFCTQKHDHYGSCTKLKTNIPEALESPLLIFVKYI